jgi:ADP-ribose pyrophosphatase
MNSKKKDWRTLDSKRVYRNPWFYVKRDKVKYPDGHIGYYYILQRKGPFVAIVAKNGRKTILVKEYRQTVKEKLWEFPMGATGKQENLLKAAKREFLEEAGCRAQKWKKIGSFYVGPGTSDQIGYVFVAEDFRKSSEKAKGEKGEYILDKKIVSFDKVERLIFSGKIKDGPSITAYFMLKNYLKRKR